MERCEVGIGACMREIGEAVIDRELQPLEGGVLCAFLREAARVVVCVVAGRSRERGVGGRTGAIILGPDGAEGAKADPLGPIAQGRSMGC